MYVSLLAILCLCTFSFAVQTSVPVHVRLAHPWLAGVDGRAATIAEMIEAAADLWPDDLSGVIQDVWSTDNPSLFTSRSEEDIYKVIESALTRRLGTRLEYVEALSELDEWRLAVAQHRLQPRVAAFVQSYMSTVSEEPGCATWIYWQGQILCPNDVTRITNGATSTKYDGSIHEKVHTSDHVFGGVSGPIAVMYADPTSSDVGHVLNYLLSISATVPLRVVFRWNIPSGNSGSHYISGFGASLHLKKVDYLVIDDRSVGSGQVLFNLTPPISADREWFQKQIGGRGKATPDNAQKEVQNQVVLSPEQLAPLGYGAARAVLQSSDPLRALEQLTSEFPVHATALAKYSGRARKRDKTYAALKELRRMGLKDGVSMVWVNGKPLSAEEFVPMHLGSEIRKERALVEKLVSDDIGFDYPGAITLLSLDQLGAAYHDGSSVVQLYDASDRKEHSRVISYLNDLEVDGIKQGWPRSLYSLFDKGRNMAVPLARNLHNLIIIPDMSRHEALVHLGAVLETFGSAYPIRIGVVPLASDAVSVALWYALELLGPKNTSALLKRVADKPDKLRTELGGAVPLNQRDAQLDAFLKYGTLSESHYERLIQTRRYLARLGVSPSESYGMVFIDGLAIPFNENVFAPFIAIVERQEEVVKEHLAAGLLTDDNDIDNFFYDLPTTLSARSWIHVPRGSTGEVNSTAIDLIATFKACSHPNAQNVLRDFLYNSDVADVSLRVVADSESDAGRSLVAAALKAHEQRKGFRLGFILTGGSCPFARLVYSAAHSNYLEKLSAKQLLDSLEGRVPAEKVAEEAGFSLESESETKYFWSALGKEFAHAAHLNGPALIVNGIALSADPLKVTQDDIVAIIDVENQIQVKPIVEATDITGIPRAKRSLAIELISSVISVDTQPDPAADGLFVRDPQIRTQTPAVLADTDAAFHVGAPSSECSVRFTVLMDPLDGSAPVYAATIRMLSSLHGVAVDVILNPKRLVRSLPLQKFERYDLRTRPVFENGVEVPPSVSFASLPPSAVLTMELHAPRGMVAMAAGAVYDLDNIRLADVPVELRETGVEALYEARDLLIEGHGRDIKAFVPHGLEIELESIDRRTRHDTILMESLGYFQFRVPPGCWNLKVREGGSAERYDLVSTGAQGWDSPPLHITGPGITVDTLQGSTVYPQFALHDRPTKHTGNTNGHRTHADINIFTVASGHLYERMTYIMVLSVLRHTKHSVKFWFIENFLSPAFKDLIPHLAREYKFNYELITFSWPHWLREQTEKQRMIWAYKILFLDVLFPLDLDRVIFVDADQIVRHDLYDLVQTDLQGAPYGYPPMGDDSEDMDGFRFWKKGYWAKFLRGKPYHISALYVVDLQRFREMGAGDMIRKHYQQLSADPNSLANLDQDLPNHRKFLADQFNISYLYTHSTRRGCGVRHGALTSGCIRQRQLTSAATRKLRSRSLIVPGARFRSGMNLTQKLRSSHVRSSTMFQVKIQSTSAAPVL